MPDIPIRIAPYAPLLEYKKNYSPEFVREMIQKHQLKGMRIFAHLSDERMTSYDFLRHFTFLETLHISTVDDPDYSFLESLGQLKGLGLTAGTKPIDLSHSARLESLWIGWGKMVTGIEACTNLKELSISGYRGKDLLAFSQLTKLTELRIKDCSIASTAGIASMGKLDSVLFGLCRSLKDISAVGTLKELNKIRFDACSRIYDFSALADCAKLQDLDITGCRKIKSIAFLHQLPGLKRLALVGNTEVEDGDISPAQPIPSLFYVARKHYNMTIPTREADELRDANKAKLQEILKHRQRHK